MIDLGIKIKSECFFLSNNQISVLIQIGHKFSEEVDHFQADNASLAVIGLFWQTFIDNISTFNVRHDELGKFLWRSILVYSTHLMYNKNQLIAGF